MQSDDGIATHNTANTALTFPSAPHFPLFHTFFFTYNFWVWSSVKKISSSSFNTSVLFSVATAGFLVFPHSSSGVAKHLHVSFEYFAISPSRVPSSSKSCGFWKCQSLQVVRLHATVRREACCADSVRQTGDAPQETKLAARGSDVVALRYINIQMQHINPLTHSPWITHGAAHTHSYIHAFICVVLTSKAELNLKVLVELWVAEF